MIKYEDECCGCSSSAYPCIGSSCPRLNVAKYSCDECNGDDQLYYYDERELCLSCIEQLLEKVNKD